MASMRGVGGLDFVEASRVWKVNSRELGRAARNFASGVCCDLLRIVSGAPDRTASIFSLLMRIVFVEFAS